MCMRHTCVCVCVTRVFVSVCDYVRVIGMYVCVCGRGSYHGKMFD